MFNLSEMCEKNFTFWYQRHCREKSAAWSKFSDFNGGNRPTAAFGISVLLHIEVYFFFFLNKLQSVGISHKSYDTFSSFLYLSNEYSKVENVSFSKIHRIIHASLFTYHWFGLCLQQKLKCL